MKKSKDLSPCYYCGNPTENTERLEVFNIKYKLPCCSEECKASVAVYNDWDKKNRVKSYLALAACVFYNLLAFTFHWTSRWNYLSLTGIGLTLYFYPLLLFRHTSYMGMGIKKTLQVLRFFGIFLIIVSLVFLIFTK